MSEDLKLGIIGVGGRGALPRREAHKPGEGSRVVACMDVRPKLLEQARDEWFGPDCFTTDDLGAFVGQDLDAVFVTSPDFVHEEQAVACLEAGLPVYLEKPMAITTEGCDRILRAAKETNVRLFLGHNMRYMGIIRKMKKLIGDGAIGEVKSVWCRHFLSYGGDAYFRDWHADRSKQTSLLLQKGAHDIDVIHWLSGAYTLKTSAFGNLAVYGERPRRDPAEEIPPHPDWHTENWPATSVKDLNPVVDVEDQTTMIMEMEKGILGCYLQCHFAPDACRNYTFIGTEGRIENLGDHLDSPIMLWNRRTDKYRIIGDEVHYGEPTGSGGHGGSDDAIVNEFLEHVRTGAPTVSTPQASRMAVAAGCAATASLRSGGGAVEVPALDEDLAAHAY
jgi:predicted dehydrogenase